MDIHDRLLNEREKKKTSRRYSGHAPCQRDFLTSYVYYSSATRHEWLNLFSSRHECFTSDSGLTRTRLVSCVFLTSLLLENYELRGADSAERVKKKGTTVFERGGGGDGAGGRVSVPS